MIGRSVVLLLFIIFSTVLGDVPAIYEEYAEPDGPRYVGPMANTRQSSQLKLDTIRKILDNRNIDAFLVPTADAHNSQYIAPSDARREWLSGLSGSSGTALVTQKHALVWTDGRYFTQFEIEVDTNVWSLMRQGTDFSIQAWLVANMSPGSVVGIDPTTYTRSAWNSLEAALRQVNVSLVAEFNNIVDQTRIDIGDPPPARPNKPLIVLSRNFTGKSSGDKISGLLSQIRGRNASALVLTALDDIAYTLNIRGSDIPYNPVFFSYLVIRADLEINNIILFWGDGQLPEYIEQHLQFEGTQVHCRPYIEIFEYMSNYSVSLSPGNVIWLSGDGSHAIHMAAETLSCNTYSEVGTDPPDPHITVITDVITDLCPAYSRNSDITTLSTVSPVALMKCVKNDVELQGFRTSHIKDGIAVVRFLRWVHEEVDSGRVVTEINVVDKLDELRSEEQYYKGPSFATIAGAGENGAIIHYKPVKDGDQRIITKDDVLLVDSGGQYMDGTTDITRTRHMSGSPTPAQRLAFTRVLKGQILLATAVFPRGSTGNLLETLARKALWDVGLNYAHGTGHGVGHFLNVHEGPSGIGTSLAVNDPGIVPGMIFSDEPGFYEVGEFGIRHEDIVEVIEMNNEADHIYAKGMVGDFDGRGAVGFRALSLAPHQTACLDVNILSDFEIKYINDYHARVLSTLGPILKERDLQEDYEWLERECSPIGRSGSILFKSSPFLIVATASLWFIKM